MTTEVDIRPHLLNRPLALLPSFALSPYPNKRDTAPGLAASVALLPIMGCLTSDEFGWGWGMQTYGAIRHAFLAAVNADDVAAVALLVNSPGGTVSGVFDLADTIYQARGIKPIWAILSEDAYSAAYALASAADHVTVPRTGGTGSIGIIKMHADLSKSLDKAGVQMTLLRYGAHKGDGNPFEPLSNEVRSAEQADIDYAGDLFVETVARNRGLKASEVKATEAATYVGPAGVTIGLADSVAAPDAAFADLLSTL